MVAREAVRLYQKAESGAQRIFPANVDQIVRGNTLLQKLGIEKLPVQTSIEEFSKKAVELIARAINRISRETFELISTVLITFFTLFYFFRDGPALLKRLKELSPLSTRYEDELIHRFLSVSRATFRGILLVAIIKGVLGGLTFRAFGIEAAVLWGVVMMFLSILPMVGIWVVMCPAALIMFLNGDLWQGVLMLGAALVVGSVDNILEPVLIGRQSGMHDLLVFFSMLGGLVVFGVTGFIVGPVIAALFLALLDIYGIEFSKQLQALHDSPADPRQSRVTSASP
jgi:predicted PurR-regulated permease PerM